MLCLMDSIRQDEPAVQRLLRAVDEAHTRTEIILAVWPLAHVLAMHLIEAVLAERARSPTCWPQYPQGCESPPVAPLENDLGVHPSQRTRSELQSLGCALAVFVPLATAATLLRW